MPNDIQLGYTGLNACTVVENSTYLSHTGSLPIASEPISGSTTGLLMMLSLLQYQAPYVSPEYSTAASQAGKAAYVQSGGQAVQDGVLAKAEKNGKETVYKLGVTDTQLGVVLGTAKVIRDKQLNLNGPKIYTIKTNLTATQNSGSIGFRYEW